jgi:flagellar biosynthetic protein FliQ
MTPESVVDLGQNALALTLMILAVLLLPALGIGLLVSMFQAATQINEQTLSFIPKLFVVLAVMIAAGPWLLRSLVNYTEGLIHSIPALIG